MTAGDMTEQPTDSSLEAALDAPAVNGVDQAEPVTPGDDVDDADDEVAPVDRPVLSEEGDGSDLHARTAGRSGRGLRASVRRVARASRILSSGGQSWCRCDTTPKGTPGGRRTR